MSLLPAPVFHALLLCFLLGGAGCASSGKKSTDRPAAPAAPDPRLVETFEAAWAIIYNSHYDTNFNGADWNAVRTEFRPRAEMARNNAELRLVLEDMLDRLNQSHVGIFPGNVSEKLEARPAAQKKRQLRRPPGEKSENAAPAPEAETEEDGAGTPGFEVRFAEGQFVVSRVEPGGSANAIAPGWILKKANGFDLTEAIQEIPENTPANQIPFLAWRMATAALCGRPGSILSAEFLDEKNKPAQVTLQRRAPSGAPVKLGSFPELHAQFHSEILTAPRNRRAGCMRFNMWMVPTARQIDLAMDEMRHLDGIVLDLRGNVGGLAGMIMGVSGHFLNERVSLGTMKMRDNQLQFFANPRRVSAAGERVTPFAGPLAILTDGASLSASEIFAGGMQDIGRARIFGETTPGQALPAIWDKLPNGDVLYHPFADFVTPSGARLEARGVIPNEIAPLRRADALAGRDRALEAALAWIASQ